VAITFIDFYGNIHVHFKKLFNKQVEQFCLPFIPLTTCAGNDYIFSFLQRFLAILILIYCFLCVHILPRVNQYFNLFSIINTSKLYLFNLIQNQILIINTIITVTTLANFKLFNRCCQKTLFCFNLKIIPYLSFIGITYMVVEKHSST
jgi:hypothetical protein